MRIRRFLLLAPIYFTLIGCGKNPMATVPDVPDEATVLEAAKKVASETLALNKRVIEAENVEIKGSSLDGASCLVIANVKVIYLPDFKGIDSVYRFSASGYARWFVKMDFKGQRFKKGITFANVRFKFRRFDTGWQFEGLEEKP